MPIEHRFFGKNIEQLIPQRAPMVMVSALYDATETAVHTGFAISSENIFCPNFQFLEAGLLEHIAQSALVLFGYKAFLQKCPAPIGYIGEVKKCHIYSLPTLGSLLDTYVNIVSEINGISLIKARTFVRDQLVVECQMKLLVKN